MNLELGTKVFAIVVLQILGFIFAMGAGRAFIGDEQGKKGAKEGGCFCVIAAAALHIVATMLAMSI